MSTDDDVALAHQLYGVVADLLTWLEDYPAEEVDPNAVTSIQRSVEWVLAGLRTEQRSRLASGDPDPADVTTAAGLFADVLWWLDTCDEAEVDLHVAVKLEESCVGYLDELSEPQRRRLIEILGEMAAVESHDGRRYELRVLPYAVGLVDEEPDAERPSPRTWVPPEARVTGA
ncbi:MAG: hypothetical protein HOV77_17145 [Hamadaea sp.]|uniref:hypothetical protein n=1 Tax=Hamadaea sp. TaxID=2024425 RepID=UPI00181F33D3|nr:hypothetical protein [Hamadaea sp.]NUT20908.1 hypothetical protein [Hamadaea sp.]